MAVPGHIDTVPDLYCREVLPDFDSSGCDGLYAHPTSTKDSTTTGGTGSPGNGKANPCTECGSLFCSNQEDYISFPRSAEPRQNYAEDDHLSSLSYHDIWCDDSVSWGFSASDGSLHFDADDNDSSSLTTWPDLTVPEIAENSDEQDLLPQETGPSHDSLEDGDASQNVPTVQGEEFMLPDDILAELNSSPRSVPGLENMADLIDTDWWDLSQVSSFSFSQTSQSSALNDDENAQTVPTLRSILQQHSRSVNDTSLDMMETDERSEENDRRRQLLFNSSCAGVEQVVPTWPPEE